MKDWKDMTDEEKRIAIAEFDGFTAVRRCASGTLTGVRPYNSVPATPDQGYQQVPDYLNDLNVMQTTWETLTKEQHNLYRCILAEVVKRDGHVVGPCRSLSHATAAQRAEAFYETMKEQI